MIDIAKEPAKKSRLCHQIYRPPPLTMAMENTFLSSIRGIKINFCCVDIGIRKRQILKPLKGDLFQGVERLEHSGSVSHLSCLYVSILQAVASLGFRESKSYLHLVTNVALPWPKFARYSVQNIALYAKGYRLLILNI